MAVLKGIIGARSSCRSKDAQAHLQGAAAGARALARRRCWDRPERASTRASPRTSRPPTTMPRAGASSSTRSRASPTSRAIAWHGRLVGEWTRQPSASGAWARSRRLTSELGRVRGASTDGRPHPAGRRRRGEGAHEHRRHHRRARRLKTAGVGAMKGLCPFHDERSPSFNVRPQAGFYHCFGCGESGDVYSFLQTHGPRLVHRGGRAPRRPHRLRAALRRRGSGLRHGNRARLFAANAAAAEFFVAQLRHARGRARPGDSSASAASMPGPPRTSASATPRRAGTRSRDHLHGRGLLRRGARGAGLVSQGQRGVYDRFRGRLRLADPRRHRSGHRLRRAPAARRRQGPEVPQHPRDRRSTTSRRCSTGSTSPSATSRASTASSSSRATPTSWRATSPASRPRSRPAARRSASTTSRCCGA